MPLQLAGASGSAQFVLPSLAAGTHQIVAMYTGGTTFAASTSAPITEAVRAADGPHVTSLRRYGYHAQPTYLVLTFDGPLAEATAARQGELPGPRPGQPPGPGRPGRPGDRGDLRRGR